MVQLNYNIDRLKVEIYPTRRLMGAAAAKEAAGYIQQVSRRKQEVNILFAAAPSQDEFLAALTSIPGVPWHSVNAFQLDEYIGLPREASQLFARYLDTHVASRVTLKRSYCINPANDPDAECQRYAALLRDFPPDLACIGIGENGHIAFNDPPVADFHDPKLVKVVELDRACRMQQVHDGCFPSLDDTPTHAITLTIPAIMQAQKVVCVVPGKTKQEAVQRTLLGPINEVCPASVIRKHETATLYLDSDAALKFLAKH
ncbi:MAG: 6-phosphogluconolactonase [Limnochordia bacterium]